MSNIIPIEHKNQRVITTKVMAEQFGTEEVNIKMNFSNNRPRFEEGKHFYKLEGAELADFKRVVNEIDDPSVKYASVLTLWTERGTARHAKILETDEAWEVYEELEESYFKPKQQIQQPLQIDSKFLFQIAAQLEEKEKRISGLTTENKLLAQENLTWADRKVIDAVVKKYGAKVGFEEAWREFKKELLYKHGINLNLRITNYLNESGKKTKPRTMDMIHDSELQACISTAVAICRHNQIDISEIIGKFDKSA